MLSNLGVGVPFHLCFTRLSAAIAVTVPEDATARQSRSLKAGGRDDLGKYNSRSVALEDGTIVGPQGFRSSGLQRRLTSVVGLEFKLQRRLGKYKSRSVTLIITVNDVFVPGSFTVFRWRKTAFAGKRRLSLYVASSFCGFPTLKLDFDFYSCGFICRVVFFCCLCHVIS